MKPYKYILGLTLLFGLTLATADTPPPSTVTAKIKDSSGNAINATAGSLNVNVTNPGGGTTTVNQGTPNAGGAAAWFAQITNFPSIQPVSQSGAFTTGRTWNLLNSTDSVNSVQSGTWSTGRTWTLLNTTDSVNAVESGTWTVGVSSLPSIPAGSNAIGSVSVSNFPATQPVSGSVSVSNFPATQPVSQVGSWTVTQGSPPWSFNLNQLNGASPSVTNYLPSRITNGTSFVDPTQIRALNSGTDSVTVTGTIATSPTAPSDATASGTMGSSGATVVVSASGIADGAVNIVGAFVGSIQIQCLAYGGSNTANLSTLQSGLWSSAAITAPGFYKFRGANGCQSVQAAYSAYTSGSPVVSLAANQAVGNPVVSQPNAANLKTASWLNDGAGNAVTSQVSGSQRPLDASILVGGSIVDPRQRNWNLNSVGDSVSAVVTNFPATQPVSGTVTANQGGAWSVTANAGTNLNTSLLALDTSVNGILQSQGSTTSGQKGPLIQGAVSTSAPSYTTAQTSPLSLTTSGALRVDASASTQPVSGTVTANQGGAPWSENISQVGGVSVAASSINGTNRIPVYLGSGVAPNTTAPNWMDVMGGVDGTGKAQALSMTATQALKVDGSSVTQPVSGTVTANAGTGTFTVGQATGSNLHVVVDTAPTTAVTQSGTWTVQPGNTANTTPWLATINQGGNSATVTGSNALKVDGSSVTQPISAASLPLPTGAATSAKQPALGTAGSASSDVLSVQGITSMTPLKVDGSGVTQPVSGTVAATQSGAWNIGNITGTVSLPTGASTAANQATEIASLATIATNTGAQAQDFQSSGTITATNGTVSITGQGVYTATFSITGTWSASLVVEGQTQDLNWIQVPVNIISSTLPYQQTSGAITTNGVYSVTGGGFLNIRVRASSYTSGTVAVGIDGSLSQQTVIANITTPDLSINGASAQTAIVNNIMGATSGTAATYAAGFHSANVQVVSTGTGGTFIFEGSNDNVNFQAIPVYSQLIATGTPITAAITATASQSIYTFPVTTNYIRLRIVTAITGGSIQAFTKLSQTTWSPAFFQVAQATAGNLQTTATIASGTVTTVSTVTSVATDNIGANVTVADRASSASTTTFTSAAIVPASGQISYSVQVAATLVSGTAPTMDCVINESTDTGTTWFTVYSFERITAAATLQSPLMRFTGNRIQYVCTIGGTTPSFTFSINRVGSNVSAQQDRRFFDRTLAPNTASSATGAWLAEGCQGAQVVYSQSAVTTNPTLTIQTSEDSSNWANTSYTIVPTGAGTFTTVVPQLYAKYARLFVTNAGTGVTYTYSSFRCAGP
jgi:hypothetical protein